MKVIVDTDALLGIFNGDDLHFKHATQLALALQERDAVICILPTTLGEFALLASSRINAQRTQEAIYLLTHSGYRTIDVSRDMTEKAAELYQRQTSKEESLFDCFNMIAAQKISADCIFSFDRGYKENGFVLIDDFLKHKV